MTALLIVLGILAFIFFLLVIPLRLRFDYGAEPLLVLRYLFFKKTLIPEKVKDKAEEEVVKEVPEAKNKLQELKDKHGLKGLLRIITELVKLLGTSAKRLLRHIKVKELDIYAVAGGENAADAAMLYGEACAVIYPAVNIVKGVSGCKNIRATVDVNYTSGESSAICAAEISILPLFALGEGFRLIFKLIPYILKLR